MTIANLYNPYRNLFGHATTAGNAASQDSVTSAKVGHALSADIRVNGICLQAECMNVNSATKKNHSSKKLFLAIGSVIFASSGMVLQITHKTMYAVKWTKVTYVCKFLSMTFSLAICVRNIVKDCRIAQEMLL